jgi:hypothetical protein
LMISYIHLEWGCRENFLQGFKIICAFCGWTGVPANDSVFF